MVPVLSKTTVSMLRVASSACGPLMKIPSCAPRPEATIRAVGVARPSAHGQAMINTARAGFAACVTEPSPSTHHATNVARDNSSTIGTKTEETLSASRCASDLPDCASATIRDISASRVCSPTAVARDLSRPETATVPPTTSSPSSTGTGRLSPVIIEVSTSEAPPSTTASAAIVSPGRVTKTSPTPSLSAGIRISAPDLVMTVTSLAASAARASSVSPARRVARASRNRPKSTNVVTPVATSK